MALMIGGPSPVGEGSRALFDCDVAERFCFRGAVDDWIDIGGPPQELPRVIGKFIKHLGRDSFFELF